MKIELQNISKRYRFEWIFKKIDFTFSAPNKYAVLGYNGSGKSTLMKILAGHLTPSKGKALFTTQGKNIDSDQMYQHVSFAAPYIELIEEYTLTETIQFHQQFKPFKNNWSVPDVLDMLQLKKSAKKEIRYFSSGMKQRLKLVLAICSEADLLLLDEPTSNLDEQGIEWYRSLIEQHTKGQLVIIASNAKVDYDFCDERLNVVDYK